MKTAAWMLWEAIAAINGALIAAGFVALMVWSGAAEEEIVATLAAIGLFAIIVVGGRITKIVWCTLYPDLPPANKE